MHEAPFLQSQPDGALLRVKVQPRAPRSEVVGVLGDELKIKIAAPPVDSAANDALVEFLAAELDCPRRCVELLRGHKSPHKVLKLHGLMTANAALKLVPVGCSSRTLALKLRVRQSGRSGAAESRRR